MFNIILAVQIVVAIAMVGLILIQQGKGADAGASFGAGASGTVFGAAGSANFLTRATAFLTAIFFATSLLLAIHAREQANDQLRLDVDTSAEVSNHKLSEETSMLSDTDSHHGSSTMNEPKKTSEESN